MIKPEVKNIIFDLGGVILNIDYHLTIKAFQNLGIENFQDLYTQANQTSVFDDFEIGISSKPEFIEAIQKLAGIRISSDQIISAWNAMLLDLPHERFNDLKKLKSSFKLYLLSNTNEIHVDAFKQIIQKAYDDYWFDDVFDKVYFSNEIGMRKPNMDIFQYVLSENDLNKTETVFFDDSIQHVEGARKVGINSFLITKEKPFSFYLSSFLS